MLYFLTNQQCILYINNKEFIILLIKFLKLISAPSYEKMKNFTDYCYDYNISSNIVHLKELKGIKAKKLFEEYLQLRQIKSIPD